MKNNLVALFAALALGVCVAPAQAAEKHDHSGHSHSHSHDGEEEVLEDIGKVSLLGTTITVSLSANFAPGKEAAIEANLPKGASDDAVMILRAWVGNETADQTGKNKAEKEGRGHFHAHGMVPKQLTDKDAIWIEVEGKDRKKVRASLPIPKAKK